MRSTRVPAAAAAAALLGSGCTIGVGTGQPDPGAAPAGSPAAPQVCAEVTFPAIQGGSHLVGETSPPVPYSSTPGTSGWHASGPPRTGVQLDPALTEPEIVSAVELGQVVIAYDPAATATAEIDAMIAFATQTDGSFTLTPYTGPMGAPIVLNAWGARQPCSTFDPDVATAFLADHGGPRDDH